MVIRVASTSNAQLQAVLRDWHTVSDAAVANAKRELARFGVPPGSKLRYVPGEPVHLGMLYDQLDPETAAKLPPIGEGLVLQAIFDGSALTTFVVVSATDDYVHVVSEGMMYPPQH